MLSIHNPLTGRKVVVGGKTYQQLLQQGVIRNSREEPSHMANLAIPSDLTRTMAPCQKGGGNGGNGCLLEHPQLREWQQQQKITDLLPTTLVPAKVILQVYYEFIDKTPPHNAITIADQLERLVDSTDWQKYVKQHHMKNVTTQTPVPFAILMGPTVFKQLM
uniref:Uncharacterized protein n=1 Tax=viral metagenome TaxID=1070528 RepID=A0A6C0BK83_9ZZZZ